MPKELPPDLPSQQFESLPSSASEVPNFRESGTSVMDHKRFLLRPLADIWMHQRTFVPEQWVRPKMLASRLSVSVQTIYNYIKKGLLKPPVSFGGTPVYFSESEIQRFMQARGHECVSHLLPRVPRSRCESSVSLDDLRRGPK